MSDFAPKLDTATVHPRGDLILCTRYERPAIVGSLHIPEAFRNDPSWCWWEAVVAGPEVERMLGIKVEAGDILRTPFRPGIDAGYEDAAGRRLFFLSAEHNAVNGVIKNYWSKLDGEEVAV